MVKHLPADGPLKLFIGPHLFHYEIDLVLTEGENIYAIEFMGQHYKIDGKTFDGNSKLKFNCMNYYGIKTIHVDCTLPAIIKIADRNNPNGSLEAY